MIQTRIFVLLSALAAGACYLPPEAQTESEPEVEVAAQTAAGPATAAADRADAPHVAGGTAATLPSARLPRAAGPLAPAHTEIAPAPPGTAGTAATGAHLADVDTCGECHLDVAAQWGGSAHAFASFSNPIYRVSIEQYRAVLGPEASRFCGGCHDPALLIDGALDGAPIPPGDVRAHTGVSCRVCHGITETRPDGNGSYTLRATPIPLPVDGDPASLEQHRAAVSRTRIGSDLCTACHRSFIGAETGHPHHLTGMDDSTDWQGSAFAASGTGRVDDVLPRQSCIDCHMAQVPAPLGDVAATDGTVSSHEFLGAHTWLAAMRRDAAQLERASAFLQGVASIDVGAVVELARGEPGPASWPASSPRPVERDAPLAPALGIDVVVRSLRVGHRFPGGVRDAQDTWIELVVRDVRGVVIAQSGQAHERDPGDTEAHVLRTMVANEDGVVQWEREVHAFRSPMADHTLAPRDAAVVRYRLELPEAGEVHAPLELHARLRHRTRNLALQAAACADSRSARGRSFDRGAAAVRGAQLDPCAPQPVITVAEHRSWIGPGAGARIAASEQAALADRGWRRPYEHGLAWLNASQEYLDEARPSLLAALAGLPADDQRGHAMVMTALGTLAGRQGRTSEAMEWLDRAERLVPGHAAINASRGSALTRVWRWREAVAPLAAAVAKAATNRQAHGALAMALGSVGSHREALAAAHAGLAVTPRDEALLRVQALSLAALGAADAASALDAYDGFRTPDVISDLRFACAVRDPMCAREQPAVHEHLLLPVRR
jgi:tetratricopeptide (TPR) repeat protein